MELFFYFILLLFFILTLGSAVLASFRAAPWLPTNKSDLTRIVDLAQIKEGELIYDFGSGDGRIIFEIARRYKVKAIGLEISAVPFIFSVVKLWLMNNIFVHDLKGEVNFFYKDFYLQNLNKADIVFCFLLPKPMAVLKKKFQKELKKGSRVISYVFSIPNIYPAAISKPNKDKKPIFLYKFN